MRGRGTVRPRREAGREGVEQTPELKEKKKEKLSVWRQWRPEQKKWIGLRGLFVRRQLPPPWLLPRPSGPL
ncbi:hypothetical protein B296_00017446, partial [Ensete ventricosum]